MIDIAIFIIFFSINLIVGLRYRGRSQSFREYAIGSKTFSTATLTATIVATWASGGFFFYTLEQTYSTGLYFIIATLGIPLGLLITGHVVGPRMGNFLNNVSMAEAMGDLYGRGVQAIAGIGGVFKNIGSTAIQFKVISKVLAILFSYNGPEITIIAATIITLYSAFGGVKAVTFTDVVQFFTFGTFIPVLALSIWQNIQDPDQVARTLSSNPVFNFKEVIGWNPNFLGTLILMSYYMTPSLPPQLFQRIAMARDITQVKRSITYAAGIFVLIILFIVWVGVLLLADNSTLDTSQVVHYMVDRYTYPGLKGLLGVGVIALAMSTADSTLNSCAVMTANDILPSFSREKKAGSVFAARLSTLVLGCLSLLMALSIQNLLQILLLSANFYIPGFTVPILLTIFGFRTSRRAMFIGIGAGFATTACFLLYFKNVNSFFPGMIANFTFLMGSHYLLGEPGGWQKGKAEEDFSDIQQAYSRTWKDKIIALKDIKLLDYLEKRLPDKESYYPLLAFYLFTATYASLYNLSYAAEKEYLAIYRTIQYSILIISTCLVAHPIWPQPLKSKRFLAWLWPLLICYTLFFVGGMLVIMGEFQSEQVLIFMLNLVMTVLLVHWPLALTVALTGLVAATLLFKWVMDVDVLANISTTISFRVSHGLLLFSSLLIALFRHKQAQAHLVTRQQQLEVANREANSWLVEALRHREEFLKELNTEEIEFFDSTTAAYIINFTYRVKNYLKLKVSNIGLGQLLEKAVATFKLQTTEPTPIIHLKKHTKHQELQVDVAKIKELLVNSLSYVQNHSQHGRPIMLGLEDTILGYELSYLKNYAKKIDAVRITITPETQLPPTKELYKVNPQSPVIPPLQHEEDDLTLAYNRRIVDAHYGYMETTATAAGYTQVYVVPVSLREARRKVIELLRDKVAPDPAQLSHPLAIQLEKELLEKLRKAAVDLKLVHKALNLIKRYHSLEIRKSGEPFFTHPMAVACILLDYTQDQDAVLAALLHDMVEDTKLTLAELRAMFGATVEMIVRGVTNLDDQLRKVNLAKQESIPQFTDYQDIRVVQVKLADRLHNMRTIDSMPRVKQQQKAQETIQLFVQLAKSAGLEAVAKELKERALAILGTR
ncbi:MAG: HD domain-containing protein, partial [Bacteroidota bacterium]